MSKLNSIALGIFLTAFAGAAQAGDAAAGKEKSATCVACHGEDGNSASAQFPRLAGQYADYIEHALLAYKTGERQNAIMAGFAADLTAEDRADLAAWYSRQPGGLFSIDGTDLD